MTETKFERHVINSSLPASISITVSTALQEERHFLFPGNRESQHVLLYIIYNGTHTVKIIELNSGPIPRHIHDKVLPKWQRQRRTITPTSYLIAIAKLKIATPFEFRRKFFYRSKTPAVQSVENFEVWNIISHGTRRFNRPHRSNVVVQ